MKKILVVLLVLAVAGGVFAQEGDWSFNGTVEIGVLVDLDPLPGTDALVTSEQSQYNMPYDGWDGIKGQFGINYNRDGFGVGIKFTDIREDTALVGSLSYGGENFNFLAESDLSEIIVNSFSFKNLWGNYTFLNGVLFLEASYTHGWAGDKFWASDTTGAIGDWNGRSVSPIGGVLSGKHTFTMIDGNWDQSYLAANVQLQGLSFGTMIRDVFRGFSSQRGTSDGPNLFVDDVLKNMIFGVKFEMTPVEIAAQFLVKDYGVYLGGKWFVGPVTVGLSFMGILSETQVRDIEYADADDLYPSKVNYEGTDNTRMRVGASVNYAADAYGANIKGFLGMDGNKDTHYTSVIGVEPGIFYNVIPEYLRFTLDAGFYFFSFYNNGAKDETDATTPVQFALQPQLFWNFLGTGAGGYGGTGIAIRYRLVGGDANKVNQYGLNNKFDVNFKWSF